MTAETAPASYRQQLADKFLEFKPDLTGRPLRSKLLLRLPSIVSDDPEKIIIFDPTVKLEDVFTVRRTVSDTTIEKPASPWEIGHIVAVAKLSRDLDPKFLQILRNSAGLRLFEIEQDIQRIKAEI